MSSIAHRLAGARSNADLSAWWMLSVLLIFSILSFVHRLAPVMLVGPVKDDLGLTDVQVSLILGPAFSIFYSLCGFPLGWAADRFDRRKVIFVGVLFWTLATVLSGYATTFTALFAARAVVAMGEAALIPASFSLIADRFPKERVTTALAFYSMGPKFGTSLAFFLGALALTAATAFVSQDTPFFGVSQPWQAVLLMLGLPGALLSILLLSFPEPPRTNPALRAESAGFNAFIIDKRRVIVPLLLGFGAIAIASGALLNWVPTYMQRRFDWTAMHYGSALGIVNALAALTLVPKGMIVDWLVARGMQDAPLRFYTWLLAVFTPVAAIAFLVDEAYLFLLLYGLAAVVAIPYLLYISASIQLFTPSEFRGRLIAIFLIVITIVQGFGPTLVAMLSDYVFREPSMFGVAMACIVGASMSAACFFLRRALPPLQDHFRSIRNPALIYA